MSALPLPYPELSSGGVLLRPWLADEAVALHAAFTDPEVLAFTWPSPDPYLVEDAQRFLEDQQRSRNAGQELQLAVVACGTGMLWGGVSLYAGLRDTDPGKSSQQSLCVVIGNREG